MSAVAKQQVVVVSGLSGAGKSTALNALEDMGFQCIDNLPAALMHDFGLRIKAEPKLYRKVALGIDARAPGHSLEEVPDWLLDLQSGGVQCQLLFLTADDETLVRRYGETRRRHPLTRDEGDLQSAIARERQLLEPLRVNADREIDTSQTNIHQLTHETWKSVGTDSAGMTLVMQSFAFSRGVPVDVDFLFDARGLPNPHWEGELRSLTGRDREVADWLGRSRTVAAFAEDIHQFLKTWLEVFERSHRSLVTVGFGCTGGRHRSVYLAERIAANLEHEFGEIMVHHRELMP